MTTFFSFTRRSFVRAAASATLALVAAPALFAGLAGEARAANLPEKIRIGTEGLYAPFSYIEGGTLTGFDVEVVRAAAEKLGIAVEFTTAPWDSLVAGLDAGRFDAVFNQVVPTEARRAKYAFTKSYMVERGVLVVRTDNASIASFDNLSGKRAAGVLTANWTDLVREKGATLVPVKEGSLAFQLVASRRADATVNSEIAFVDYMKTHRNAPLKAVAHTTEGAQAAGLFRRKDAELVAAFSRAIEELKADGTLLRLSVKFLGVDATPGI